MVSMSLVCLAMHRWCSLWLHMVIVMKGNFMVMCHQENYSGGELVTGITAIGRKCTRMLMGMSWNESDVEQDDAVPPLASKEITGRGNRTTGRKWG